MPNNRNCSIVTVQIIIGISIILSLWYLVYYFSGHSKQKISINENYSDKIIYDINGLGKAINGESMKVMFSLCNDLGFSTFSTKSNYYYSISKKKSFIVIRGCITPIDSRYDIILNVPDGENIFSKNTEFICTINEEHVPNHIVKFNQLNLQKKYKKGNIKECVYVQLVLPLEKHDISSPNSINFSIEMKLNGNASIKDNISLKSKDILFSTTKPEYIEFKYLDRKPLDFVNNINSQISFINSTFNESAALKHNFDGELLEIVLHKKWGINSRKYALYCLKELDKDNIIFTPISYIPEELKTPIDKEFLKMAIIQREKIFTKKQTDVNKEEDKDFDLELDAILRGTR